MTADSAAGDADVARVAALIGDRTRARVLMALSDGRALPASVLAAEAGVAASTISGHLAKLLDAQLLMAQRSGRARYFRLADPAVANALEAIARIAPPQAIRSLRQGTHAYALRRARTCYDHLAGRLGVALMAALLEGGLLERGDGKLDPSRTPQDRPATRGGDTQYRLTATGRGGLTTFGLDAAAIGRRRPVRYCVDWSEQRHHLAGPLGAALTARLLELDWIRRTRRRRVVLLTDAGRSGLNDAFAVPEDWDKKA